MIYLYDTDARTYINVTEYLESVANDAGTLYRLIIGFTMDEIFEAAKKRTAWRGRFARNEQGGSNIEKIALTDDDRDMFDDHIKRGAGEVFRSLSAWSKEITGAFRFNVKFGAPVASGSITSGGSTITITDTSLALTVDELAGYKLVITSPGALANQEQTIVSNTANTITLAGAFASDATDLEYAVMTQTDDYILFYLNKALTWDTNMLIAATEATREALVAFFVKEWYIVNRYMDDAQIEAARYESELADIHSALYQRKTPLRRSGEIFS